MGSRYQPGETLEGRRLLSFGGLDPSFGNGGVVTSGEGSTRSAALDVLPDGRIVTARVVEETFGGGPSSLWVTRFLANGAPDPAFGGTLNGQPPGTPGGTVRVTGTRLPHDVVDLRVTKQGKIILCGTFDNGSPSGDLTVVRLNANGMRDVTFGGSSRGFDGASLGVAFADFGDTHDRARALAVAHDGRIAVVGTSEQATARSGVAAIFTAADGTLDTSFDDDGKSVWGIGERGSDVTLTYDAQAASFDHDGQLVVAGSRNLQGSAIPNTQNWELQRIGTSATPLGPNPFDPDDSRIDGTVQDVAVLKDDSMLVAGTSKGALVVAKVLTDGTIDRAFAENGVLRTPLPSFSEFLGADAGRTGARRLVVLPDGRFYILAQGIGDAAHAADRDVVFVARYTSGGSADPMFGGLHKVDGGDALRAADLAIRDDDAIIMSVVAPLEPGAIGDVPIRLTKIAGGAPAAQLSKRGTLQVSGTSTGETITVTRRPKDGRVLVRVGATVRSFAPSRVKRIQIYAQGGNDTVTIGAGVRGTFVDAGPGRDTVTGGDGNDTLVGGLGSDRLVGGNGNDVLSGGGGRDYLLGSAGHDKLRGGAGIDTLNGAGGNDLLSGGGDGAADSILGGAGADTVAPNLLDFVKDVEHFLASVAD